MKETQCILEHTEGQSDIVLNSEVQKCPGNAELLRQHQQLIPSRSRRARQRLSSSLTFSPGVLAVLFVGFLVRRSARFIILLRRKCRLADLLSSVFAHISLVR